MKIQLQSLRVVNCGPLRDVCIHFNTNGDSPTTVLAGANGSGKTTVLKLIVELAGMLNNSIDSDADDASSVLERVDYAQMNCQVVGEDVQVFYGDTQFEELHNNHYGTVVAPKFTAIGDIRKQVSRKTKGTILKELRDLIREQEDKVIPANNPASVPAILYFPHERSILPVRERTQLYREETIYQWVYQYRNVNSFQGSLDSYLIWLDYAEPDTYAQVIDFLNSVDLDGKKFGVQRRELRAIVTTKDGQTHGVAELSSGEQNILIMLLELRRRLLPYSIVLIDEIENSLHAAFQHRLGQALRKMQSEIPFQLILTTHASDFARIFGPESVRILTEF